MTSKELLKEIQDNYTWEEGVFYKEHFKQIEKDLEVLEIIKKIKKLYLVKDLIMRSYQLMIFLQ